MKIESVGGWKRRVAKPAGISLLVAGLTACCTAFAGAQDLNVRRELFREAGVRSAEDPWLAVPAISIVPNWTDPAMSAGPFAPGLPAHPAQKDEAPYKPTGIPLQDDLRMHKMLTDKLLAQFDPLLNKAGDCEKTLFAGPFGRSACDEETAGVLESLPAELDEALALKIRIFNATQKTLAGDAKHGLPPATAVRLQKLYRVTWQPWTKLVSPMVVDRLAKATLAADAQKVEALAEQSRRIIRRLDMIEAVEDDMERTLASFFGANWRNQAPPIQPRIIKGTYLP